MTALPFILSPTSHIEFAKYWGEHAHHFIAPANEPDPSKRALMVLKWYMSTLKQHFIDKDDQGGRKKKPLNSFLGEFFLGKWTDVGGTTTSLVAEQVRYELPLVVIFCYFV